MRKLVLVPFIALALPAALKAQWRAIPHAGYIQFDEATAIEAMPVAGIDLVRDINETIGIGLTIDYARGSVNGNRFPPAELNFGPDSTIFVFVDQPVSVFHYGVWAEWHPVLDGPFQPYVGVGAGGYSFYMSAQQWDRPATIHGPRLAAGGGVQYEIGGVGALILDVRDVIYPSFDPNQLNGVSEENRADLFPELNPPPLTEGTMHNMRLTIGLAFQSGGGE